MSDVILRLPHYHRHIAIYDFRSYVSFTGFECYIAIRCGFDKQLYLTSCLNAQNHNTYIRLPQTGCTARKMALFISKDRQTEVFAANAMATTIIIDYNSWFPWSLSPAKCSIASTCNNPSDHITEIRYLEQFDYYNQKQNKVLYVNMENVDFLLLTAPSLVFAGETNTPYDYKRLCLVTIICVNVSIVKLCFVL